MFRYRMTLSYLGTNFHGFARQPNLRTIQGEVEDTLSRILGEPIVTVGAGRTDRGVHANGQVISFGVSQRHPNPSRLAHSLSQMLSPEIAARDCAEVRLDFDARFSAKSRTYHYQVLLAEYPDPLRHHLSWYQPPPFDLPTMNLVSQELVGQHEFSSFCRRGFPDECLERTVLSAWWEERNDDLVVFVIKARAFCHQMVRSLAGLGVAVGQGKIQPEEIPAIFAAKDRSAAPAIAPPQGLILWHVSY